MPPVAPSGVLVGRDSELAMLAGLVKRLAARRGGSVLVEGEPGIGKTALVQAALASAPKGSFQVFWGAGDELGQALPLLPFLDALRVREPSGDPRRVTIVRLLRGEIATLHAAGRGGGAGRAAASPHRRAVHPASRPSWSSMTCSGPIRLASGCGRGWPARPGRCRCCWPG